MKLVYWLLVIFLLCVCLGCSQSIKVDTPDSQREYLDSYDRVYATTLQIFEDMNWTIVKNKRSKDKGRVGAYTRSKPFKRVASIRIHDKGDYILVDMKVFANGDDLFNLSYDDYKQQREDIALFFDQLNSILKKK